MKSLDKFLPNFFLFYCNNYCIKRSKETQDPMFQSVGNECLEKCAQRMYCVALEGESSDKKSHRMLVDLVVYDHS